MVVVAGSAVRRHRDLTEGISMISMPSRPTALVYPSCSANSPNNSRVEPIGYRPARFNTFRKSLGVGTAFGSSASAPSITAFSITGNCATRAVIWAHSVEHGFRAFQAGGRTFEPFRTRHFLATFRRIVFTRLQIDRRPGNSPLNCPFTFARCGRLTSEGKSVRCSSAVPP